MQNHTKCCLLMDTHVSVNMMMILMTVSSQVPSATGHTGNSVMFYMSDHDHPNKLVIQLLFVTGE